MYSNYSKKINTTALTFIQLFIMCSALLTSCSDEKNEPELIPVNSLSNYEEFGRIHNDFLDNAVRFILNSETRIIGNDEAKPNYEALHNEVMAQASAMDIEPMYKQGFLESLEDSKPLYDSDYLYDVYFKRVNGKRKITEDLKSLWIEGTIDGFEYQLISNLCSIIASYREGTSSYELAFNQLEMCYQRWEDHYGSMLNPAGQMSGYILGITKSSIDWWDENLDGTRIVHWVYMDAAGAIIGGIGGVIGQKLITGKINWKMVGWGTLAGAVTASTGVTGKLAAFLRIPK